MEKTTYIFGIRTIMEAIESEEAVAKVYLLTGNDGVLINNLKGIAKKNGIAVSFVPIEKLDHLARGNHQGAVAAISPVAYQSLEEILEQEDENGTDDNSIYLLLDGITDVRNFGAIIRTAECTGVKAIVVSASGSAPINAASIKTSAGAAFKIPICKVDHIKDAVFLLQSYGITTVGATEKSAEVVYDTELKGKIALVLGSEEKGINPSTLKILDKRVKLPMKGEIASLNVSVACGALLYEIIRQQG